MCQRTLSQEEPLSLAIVPFKRGLALSPLSCYDTVSETSISTTGSSTGSTCSSDANDGDIQLIQRPSSRGISSSCALRHFEVELSLAAVSSATTLVLSGFIERSTRHDIYALRDFLVRDDCPCQTVQFQDDVAYASNFRRFAYKKENINHHIQAICLRKNICLDYQIRLDLDVDDLALDSVLSLLAEVKKHPEVRQLSIAGHLNPTQERTLLQKLTSLLRQDDRDWTCVNVFTGFVNTTGNDDHDDYQQWRDIMMEYMEIFSQLYTKYNIPIDIRPCCD
ncbi:expressed unknown protein [Seminavis robusta]|uniref:Uncharacterized protein n=1 Tax=Seminavis robusta TaxID=568900 RepID=A0A9N8EC03_9STRA|nr:expressed unknown protein [Seminavis robusta]|eukprot:Sro786_g202240.1 n/a (279) ;mRNA; f:16040-16876